jgi:hypothetical protein
LKASAVLRLEARKALLQDSRGLEVRLNFSFARRYVLKFVFQIDGALLGVASNLGGKLCDFPHVGHFLPPTTSGDKPQHCIISKSEACGFIWVDAGAKRSRKAPTPLHSGAISTQHHLRPAFRVC